MKRIDRICITMTVRYDFEDLKVSEETYKQLMDASNNMDIVDIWHDKKYPLAAEFVADCTLDQSDSCEAEIYIFGNDEEFEEE